MLFRRGEEKLPPFLLLFALWNINIVLHLVLFVWILIPVNRQILIITALFKPLNHVVCMLWVKGSCFPSDAPPAASDHWHGSLDFIQVKSVTKDHYCQLFWWSYDFLMIIANFFDFQIVISAIFKQQI